MTSTVLGVGFERFLVEGRFKGILNAVLHGILNAVLPEHLVCSRRRGLKGCLKYTFTCTFAETLVFGLMCSVNC